MSQAISPSGQSVSPFLINAKRTLATPPLHVSLTSKSPDLLLRLFGFFQFGPYRHNITPSIFAREILREPSTPLNFHYPLHTRNLEVGKNRPK